MMIVHPIDLTASQPNSCEEVGGIEVIEASRPFERVPLPATPPGPCKAEPLLKSKQHEAAGATLLEFCADGRSETAGSVSFFCCNKNFFMSYGAKSSTIVTRYFHSYGKRNVGGISTLDYIFIIPTIVSEVGSGIIALIYKYFIVPRLFKEWMSIFGPDWPAETKPPWTDRGQKLASLIS
jgi:hypothetical protein